MTLYAHYTATKKTKQIRITDSIQPIGGVVYQVAGKVEARKMAKELKATPWNF